MQGQFLNKINIKKNHKNFFHLMTQNLLSQSRQYFNLALTIYDISNSKKKIVKSYVSTDFLMKITTIKNHHTRKSLHQAEKTRGYRKNVHDFVLCFNKEI